MKKWMKVGRIVFLLAVLWGLVACGEETMDPDKVFQIYCVSNSETKVEPHPYEMQAETPEKQLEELIDCLSTIPDKLEYKPPLAMGFGVNRLRLNEGVLQIDVDEKYLELNPITEILVRAALVRTLTQVEGVRYVEMTVNGSQLYDSNDELVGHMSAELFIDNDGNAINTYELTKVMLYFANEDGDKLIPTYREKHYSTNTPLERFVVEELIAGPNGQVEGVYPSINPETKIINVSTRDGICYVNLDSGFLTVAGNVSTEVAIYSIVNSLVELSNINKVQILINGEVPESFSNSTFERNLDYVTTLEQ